jgi:hypothetical protein
VEVDVLRVLAVILGVAVYIYCIIDVARSRRDETRSLPRWAWLLLVVLLPILGDVLWLLFGRVWRLPTRRRRGPQAPDDDPAFLKQIGDQAWNERMRQRRNQDDGPAPV